MSQFSNTFDTKISTLAAAGTLSKTGVGRFSALEHDIGAHLSLNASEIYIVACARPNNLNIRLTQGRAQHRHQALGLGIIRHKPGMNNGTIINSGLKAGAAFIGNGNAQYDAVGVVVEENGVWVIGGIIEAAGTGIAAKLTIDFPNIVVKTVNLTGNGTTTSPSGSVNSPTQYSIPLNVTTAVNPVSSISKQSAIAGDPRFHLKYKIAPADSKPKSSLPIQVLIHGCPGSGKSFEIDGWVKSVSKHILVVFHPETTYGDFVGVLRPFPVYKITTDKFTTSSGEDFIDGEPYITYQLVPGPLLEAYCYAMANPNDSVALVIEELSRANASLVFGDMLHLLDRITSGSLIGESAYPIMPKPEVQAYLSRFGISSNPAGSMRFPSNLHIWATMNRSDQNARQIDAAFLRRWQKKHMSYSQPCVYGTDKVLAPNGLQIGWDELRMRINNRLVNFAPEDKFIGPYFLPKTSLGDRAIVAEDLLSYLWNDVLKTRSREFFKFQTLTEVISAWTNGTENPFKDIELA